MAEMSTDAAALSAASTNFDGIRSFFLFEDGSSESEAGAGMQDTEKGVTGMFASAGDAGGQAVQKLSGIWGGSGSDAYQQTQSRWDSAAADAPVGDMDSFVLEDGASEAQQAFVRFRDAATKQINELNTISENINRSGTQYQQAADDAASTLGSSMGFTPPDDGFDFKAAEPGEAASDALSYNFSGIEGAASAGQPDTDGGWLLGDGGNGGIPATMAEWALLLA